MGAVHEEGSRCPARKGSALSSSKERVLAFHAEGWLLPQTRIQKSLELKTLIICPNVPSLSVSVLFFLTDLGITELL